VWETALEVYDLSGSGAPSRLVHHEFGATLGFGQSHWCNTCRLTVFGDLLLIYVGGSPGLMAVVDLIQPAAPEVVGKVGLVEYPMGLAGDGNRLYLAGGGYASLLPDPANPRFIRVIDLANPAEPRVAGSVEAEVYAMAAAAGRLVAVTACEGTVASAQSGPFCLQVVDVDDPTHPRLAGRLELAPLRPGIYQWFVVLDGDTALVKIPCVSRCQTRDDGAVYVVNVADADRPRLLTTYYLDAESEIQWAGDHLLLTSGPRAFDVSNPLAPQPIPMPAAPVTTFALSGNHLIGAGDGLWVFDLDR